MLPMPGRDKATRVAYSIILAVWLATGLGLAVFAIQEGEMEIAIGMLIATPVAMVLFLMMAYRTES